MKRKIKLRDMTAEQFNDYVTKCKMTCTKCAFQNACCRCSIVKDSWVNNKDLYSEKFLNQEVEIDIPDILDEKEKEYLSAVIRPFRDRVISISKYFYVLDNAYAIDICTTSSLKIFEKEIIRLPLFKNQMYKGMENNKAYTLDELDL